MNVQIVQAEYVPSEIELHRGNHYIEALPPTLTREELKESLSRPLPFGPEHRFASNEVRLQLVAEYENFVFFRDAHYHLYVAFDTTMRAGYVGRSPTGIHLASTLNALHGLRSSQDWKRDKHARTNLAQRSLTFLGPSGVGKTSAAKAISDLYPDVIFHERFGCFQVPVVFCVTPGKGASTGAFAMQAYIELDRRIPGATNVKDYGQGYRRVDDHPALLGMALTNVAAGICFADEQQRGGAVGNQTKETLAEVLVSLSNVIKIPLGRTGLLSAKKILHNGMSPSRRGAGIAEWEPYPKSEKVEHWAFLRYIWENVLVRHPPDVNENFLTLLSRAGGGFLAVDIMICQACQRRAIHSGAERITPGMILDVLESELSPLRPYIALSLKGRWDETDDMKAALDESKKRISDSAYKELSADVRTITQESPRFGDLLAHCLEILGVSEETARGVGAAAMEDDPDADLMDTLADAIRTIKGRKPKTPKSSDGANVYVVPKGIELDARDYRRAILHKQETGETIYQGLSKIGVLADLTKGLAAQAV